MTHDSQPRKTLNLKIHLLLPSEENGESITGSHLSTFEHIQLRQIVMMSWSVVLQENFPQIHRVIAASVADSFQDLSRSPVASIGWPVAG